MGRIVGTFKTVSTKQINQIRQAPGTTFWQRNYYEHIIRNERELQAIRRYIRQNPDNWALDRDAPDNIRHPSSPTVVEDYVREALAGVESGR